MNRTLLLYESLTGASCHYVRRPSPSPHISNRTTISHCSCVEALLHVRRRANTRSRSVWWFKPNIVRYKPTPNECTANTPSLMLSTLSPLPDLRTEFNDVKALTGNKNMEVQSKKDKTLQHTHSLDTSTLAYIF